MTVRAAPLLCSGVIALLLAASLPAAAATARVDDSGTLVSQSVVPMRWRQLVPGRGADHTVEAPLRVALRLNLAAWIQRPVRLYMALAPTPGEPVHATWTTQGRLLAGSLRSGGRTLVYDGVVSGGVLEETLDLVLRTDGRALTSSQNLQFYFEVDTP